MMTEVRSKLFPPLCVQALEQEVEPTARGYGDSCMPKNII